MAWKKQLSLCVITYNDESLISECLKNSRDYADEVIIVDLGSEDRTIELAKQAGAEVYHFMWNSNFSEVKNFCLDQAAGRWVLFLHANETIMEKQIKDVKLLLDNPNVEGYLFNIGGENESCRIFSPTECLRLFRNRKEYRFKYKSFEHLPDELLTGITDANIRIIQNDSDGYWENNARKLLLRVDMDENPDGYIFYMYAIELINQQSYEECHDYLEKALSKVNPDYMYAPHIYKCLSWSYISMHEYQKALNILNKGINVYPLYSDLLVLRSDIYKQLKQYKEAVQDLQNSLDILEIPNRMLIKSEVGASTILETLGDIHKQLFNYNQALEYYQNAYELRANYEELLNKIGLLSKKNGCIEILYKYLDRAVERKNAEEMMLLINVLFQLREYSGVLKSLVYLEALTENEKEIERVKFSCYMMLGKRQEAECCYLAINGENPYYSEILLERIEGSWYHDQYSEAAKLLEEMDRAEDIDQSVKDTYNLIQMLFEGRDIINPVKNQPEVEIISTLHENFLWFGQKNKAEILLTLLLKCQREECYSDLAEQWAERGNLYVIQRIYQQIIDADRQTEFLQRILEVLLSYGYIETAKELVKLDNTKPLGVLEHILWAEFFMENLNRSINKVFGTANDLNLHDINFFQKANITDTALVNFYDILHNDKNESEVEYSDNRLTCAEIHMRIGDYYEKSMMEREALLAYLRVLQWNPLNKGAQEKILKYYIDDMEKFCGCLNEEEQLLEGYFFKRKDNFKDYVLGSIYFQTEDFEKAIKHFQRISCNELAYTVAQTYIACALWIQGKDKEAEKLLEDQTTKEEALAQFYNNCRACVIRRLDAELLQYKCELLVKWKKGIMERGYK